MKNVKMYEPQDRMITLIKDNYSVLQALSSFGINLGFGDKTVEETCQLNRVDCYTFLAVVNYTINNYAIDDSDERISVPTLLHYLEASHRYYLDFQLPFIRRELQESINGDDALGQLMLRFYDEYAQEIRRHMKYEEKTLFPYVQSLIDGQPLPNYNVEMFSKHHASADKKLRELKLLIIKYLPGDAHLNSKLTATLYDIYNNEEWLQQHADVEDHIFTPAIASEAGRRHQEHLVNGLQGWTRLWRGTLRPRARRHHRRGAGAAEQGDCRPPVHLGQYRHHPSSQHCPQATNPFSCRPHHLRHRQWPGRYQ